MRLLRSPVLRTRPDLSRSCVLVPVHVLVLDYDYDYDYDYESEKLPPLLSLAFAGNLFIPRISAKRSECCRPSLITQHSLRRSSSPSLQRGKAVFQRSAPGEAREKRLPLAEIRGKGNPEPRKTQKCTKSCSGASLIGGNARSSPPPRPFQLLGVLGELGVGRFHAKGAKPAKGSLGRSPFCGFSWQFQVARHRLRV